MVSDQTYNDAIEETIQEYQQVLKKYRLMK